MSENLTENEQPTVKRADALEPGDHVIERFDETYRPAKVLVAHPYRNGDGRPMVSLMLDTLDGLRPLTMEYRADQMVELADEQDLADARVAVDRQALATGLRSLAQLIEDKRLPIDWYARFSIVFDGPAEVQVWAAAGGADYVERGENAVAEFPMGGLKVHVQGALPKPDPEAEQEWLFTFGAGQQFDGRFVRITGTELGARARMNLVFGHAWCDQYTWQSFDAAGLPGKVTELPEAEWPPHADEPKPTCLNLLDADNPCSNPPASGFIFCAPCMASGRDGAGYDQGEAHPGMPEAERQARLASGDESGE